MHKLKIISIYVILISMFLLVSEAHALKLYNSSKQTIKIRIYSAGELCYRTHPLVSDATIDVSSIPRKCQGATFKVVGNIRGQSKNKCRVKELAWENEVVFAVHGDKLACRNPLAKAKH